MSSSLNSYLSALTQFTQNFSKAITTIKIVCDIVPPIPSLPFFIVNLPAYIAFLVTAPVRYPLCLLISNIQELDCPQCIIYNLFPFLSILNLFGPPTENNCALFGCVCPKSATGCGECYQQTAVTASSIMSTFTCNGEPCPESWLNYTFCLLGYTFLVPFTPIFTLVNLALDKLFHKQIYFSFNCPLPSNLPG
jgi:hypothetical protein